MRLSVGGRLTKWVGFAVLVSAMGTAGCGSSTGTVSGKVSYKNTMLKGGNVSFISIDKKFNKLAEIQEDGSYKVEKVPVGEMIICVDTSSLRPTGVKMPKYAPPPGMESSGYKPGTIEDKSKRYVPVPPDYANPDKSKLRYTVTSGSQEHDIKLD